MHRDALVRRSLILATLVAAAASSMAEPSTPAGYAELVTLFEQWRAFERPAMTDGAPDYTAAAMVRKHEELKVYQSRLAAIDPSGWPISAQVDHHLVRAEMNGLDFNIRVLKPWARDPAFYASVWTYQSDTPAHEGPTHHALIELWSYTFPLSAEAEARLAGELRTIPPLLTQARKNLTGNARELWQAGIGNIRDQVAALEDLQEKTAEAGNELKSAIRAAQAATESFVAWLERQAPSKTGPSGIGKDNYTWYLRSVHLVPLTWEDEARLLKRELDRAHASLKLEEHRNRDLPALVAISSPEEYDRRANEAVTEYLAFLAQEEILPVHDYMDPALRARMGTFVPEESRNFFRTAIHFEPMTLWTHFYHWWDLARIEQDPHPSPIRRGPLLYNIFDSRAEGLATGVEEMMMHAGLYDDNPRVREIVWIMLAQRAARGLGSLYVHSGEMTMKEARDFHVDWTPRGWMREDLDLLGFEQQLYLRQPGYGTSYITGKYLIERLLAERSRQLGDDFTLSDFYRDVDAVGVIPVSLIRWQLTGRDDEIRALVGAAEPQPGPAIGSQGMVSTAHPIATEAGLSILRKGGNAFDAAVAIASTLNVVEPMMSGMGGYGTILVYDAEQGEAHYLDASGKIPMGVVADAYRPPTPGYLENRRNAKAVSTPGAANAWEAMSRRFGTMPWSELFASSIRAAEEGFPIDDRTARFIKLAFDEFPEHARAFYGKEGAPLEAGDRLVQKDLGNSLRQLAQEGASAIYGGSLGKAIDAAMTDAGGFLAYQDLVDDRAEWWRPISISYRGYEVITPSAPAGAFPMLVRLGMMGLEDNRQLGHNSVEYLHRFAEVTKHAYWTRLAYSGDPDVKPPPYDLLLSESYWRAQNARIDPRAAKPFDASDIGGAAASDNTTHFVVADRWGNVVSATVTLGNLFGSRIMPAGTGIWLNNSLAYCTFEPKGNPMDAHPGRRKLSSDSPSFVLRDGRPWVALGTPGGHTITQTVGQMIMNVVDFEMNILDAIAAPRIAFNVPNHLDVEETVSREVREQLTARGHGIRIRTLGNANGLTIDYDEHGKPMRFTGGSDPRGSGLAKGF